MLKRTRIIGIILSVSFGFAAGAARAAEIAISCSALGAELELCRDGADAWAARSGHTVRVVSTPNSATERLALYQQLFAAGADDIDVFQIDVIWPGLLAPHLIDLGPYVGDTTAQHVPALIANNTVDGRLVAMPWFTDAGLLYYRRDLLDAHGFSVPETWQALAATAAAIQGAERAVGNTNLWGYVWQGKAYEGLTCNALEWLVSEGGGTIVDADGAITADNSAAAIALDRAAGWVGSISPPGVLGYGEEEARAVFQAGDAVFMRNWPYAWTLANAADSPVKGHVGVAALPAGSGGERAATLGGWQLAVSRYSAHAEIAIDLVRYLTGPDEQKRRALAGGFNPTIAALYDDADVRAANPYLVLLRDAMADAVARPSQTTGESYNQVSVAFANAVHDVLAGRRSGAESVAALERTLTRLRRRGGW